MPASRDRGASNPNRAYSSDPVTQTTMSRDYLNKHHPLVTAADAALAALASARAQASAATARAAVAIRAVAPFETALRRAEQTLTGTLSHNERLARDARIRKCEQALANAEARAEIARKQLADARAVPDAQPTRDKRATAEAAKRLRAARDAADAAAQDAERGKLAVAAALAEARALAVPNRIRTSVTDHLRICEAAGAPWKPDHETVN